MNIKLLNITNEVYNDYITKVKNNQEDTFDVTRIKLSRNWYCSKYINTEEDGTIIKHYGNLWLYVKDGYITKIQNFKGGCSIFKVNKSRKYYIEHILKQQLQIEQLNNELHKMIELKAI